MYILDAIFKDFQTVVESIIIKYDTEAKKYETIDIRRSADQYLLAYSKKDTFRSYVQYAPQVIIDVGLAQDEKGAEIYTSDRNMIPESMRERVLLKQREWVLNTYEELNNYYRTLIGLPDVEDLIYVYIDTEIAAELNIDPTIPVHKLDTDDITRLTKSGELERIKQANPDKKYLHFLGDNKINLVRARQAKHFAILRMSSSVSTSFYEEFDTMYDQCREYFMTVVYNKEMSKQYDLLDNFLGMCIMIFTMQRVISNSFKNGIDYNFYDLGSIQKLFNAYSVPFIENLPLVYQQIIMRNLNNLLRYKSTDKVLYDICSLLGFERIKIFKYFLMKEHRLDEHGKPVFPFKEVPDGNGGTMLVEDSERMYNLFFQSVELKERNQALALSDTSTILDYNQVIVDDPYWWSDDDELKEHLYKSEFNFIETKFLSMNVMYKMTEMLFEVVYVFRLLLDKKDEELSITLELPRLFQEQPINFFNVAVLLCALLAKKNGFSGDIISTPSKTLAILGFNFNQDMSKVQEFINANKDIIDPAILKYLTNLKVYSAEDVNTVFTKITGLNDFLTEKLANVKTIEEYRAYKQLYRTLLITKENTNLFKKQDGTVATTFQEYLDDQEPLLGAFVTSADINRIAEYIDHILFRLNDKIKQLKYLYFVNDSNNVVLDAAIALVRFFKSYTTDLTSFNIFYLMDSRHLNMIHLIGDIKSIQSELTLVDDTLIGDYKSNLSYDVELSGRDIIQLVQDPDFLSWIRHRDTISIRDRLSVRMSEIIYRLHMQLKEKPNYLVDMLLKDLVPLIQRDERRHTYSEIAHKDDDSFTDVYRSHVDLQVDDSAFPSYNDNIQHIESKRYQHDKISMRDRITFIRET
ncbi:hypothetical protein D1872_36550 [compost metagenome]